VSSSIQIVEMVDVQTSEPRETSVELTLPVICNSPHRLVLRSSNGGLLRAGAVERDTQGGFAEFLPYQITADWADQQTGGASNAGTPLTIGSAGGRAGQMLVSLKVPGGGTPMVAGTYSDDIIIELQVAD
jgi:spore coat protein U-like protein